MKKLLFYLLGMLVLFTASCKDINKEKEVKSPRSVLILYEDSFIESNDLTNFEEFGDIVFFGFKKDITEIRKVDDPSSYKFIVCRKSGYKEKYMYCDTIIYR